MFDLNDLALLARYTKIPEIQRELRLLGQKDLDFALANNEALSPQIWQELFDQDQYGDITSSLLCNPCASQDQLRNILTTYPSVRHWALTRGIPHISRELLEEVIFLPDFSVSDASVLMASGTVPDELALRVWEIAKDVKLIKHLSLPAIYIFATTYGALTNQELIPLLRRVPGNNYTYAAKLLDARPSLIPDLLSGVETLEPYRGIYEDLAIKRHLPTQLATAIAASRYLAPQWADTLLSKLANGDFGSDKDSLNTYRRGIVTSLIANPTLNPSKRVELYERFILQDTSSDFRLIIIDQIIARCREKIANSEPALQPGWLVSKDSEDEILQAVQFLGVWRYPSLVRELTGLGHHFTQELTQSQLNDHDLELSSSISKEDVATLIEPTLTSLGSTSSKVFTSLLPGWQQSLEDLLRVVETTTL